MRERIIVMGGYGSGKSKAWCEVGAWYRRTNTPGKLYVIDTDNGAAEVSLDAYDNWEENTIVEVAWDFNEYTSAARKFREVGTKDDWLIVDMYDKVWDKAQAEYSRRVHGTEIDDWFIQYRADHDSGHPFSGDWGVHWTAINRLYQERWMSEVLRWPGHILVCTKAKDVQQPNKDGKGGDKPELRALMGKFPIKPGGQNDTAFSFHTILWLFEKQQGNWGVTTIRDREREQLTYQKLTNFVGDYLMGVAGWTIVT
jgi:hypothetical protein